MFQSLKVLCLAAVNCILDGYDYLRHSATLFPFKNQSVYRARLTKKYHAIEKGLALPAPRLQFGRPKALELTTDLERYLKRFGRDETAEVTLSVLEAYQRFQQRHNAADPALESRLCELRRCIDVDGFPWLAGGAKEVLRQDIARAASIDFKTFAMQRHSIRTFAPQPVDLRLIEEAVLIAQKSPSACNRQPWKVHVYHHPDTIKALLAHQNGNRGFGEYGSVLLVVTSDLGAFEGPAERHQAFVDGGMFAMSVVYALHSLGLGSCCLNLSQQNYQAKRTKHAAGINDEEVLIMMILVGALPDKLNVAMSHRRQLKDLLAFHDPWAR